MSFWGLLLSALGLAMLLEGLAYFVAPSGVRRYLQEIEKLSEATLRFLGLALIVVGLVVFYFSLRWAGFR